MLLKRHPNMEPRSGRCLALFESQSCGSDVNRTKAMRLGSSKLQRMGLSTRMAMAEEMDVAAYGVAMMELVSPSSIEMREMCYATITNS